MTATVDDPEHPRTQHEHQEPERPNRLRRWRPVAILAWLAFLCALVVWGRGLPVNAALVVVVCMTGLGAFGFGHVSQRRLFLDFLPLVAVVFVYTYVRGIADSLGTPTHWLLAPRIDQLMFGTQPVVWLQDHLMRTQPMWWDVPPALLYLSFFFLPWVIAAVLWPRDRTAFRRWVRRWVVMCFLGFACFALAPTAPPWAAARCTAAQVRDHPAAPTCMVTWPAHPRQTILGARHPASGLPPTVGRSTWRGLDLIHLRIASRTLQTGEAASDLVAAVPSLHACGSLMMMLFLWRRVRRRWRPLLVAYPVLMAWAVVYTANHYVFDILAGWGLTLVVMGVTGAGERLLARRRQQVTPAETVPA